MNTYSVKVRYEDRSKGSEGSNRKSGCVQYRRRDRQSSQRICQGFGPQATFRRKQGFNGGSRQSEHGEVRITGNPHD